MLHNFMNLIKRSIEFDQFQFECKIKEGSILSSVYYRRKDYDEPKGTFQTYESYCKTISVLNAIKAKNIKAFQALFEASDLEYDSQIQVFQNGMPYNPYSKIQPSWVLQQMSLSDILFCYLHGSAPNDQVYQDFLDIMPKVLKPLKVSLPG